MTSKLNAGGEGLVIMGTQDGDIACAFGSDN